MSREDDPSPILVTGFGPFHQHKVNASWEAVKDLVSLGVKHKGEEIPVEIREVPVIYEIVSKLIPELWDEFKPRLCVHVGVSPYKCIKIEKVGNNVGYGMPDIVYKTPTNGKCVENGPHQIETIFNVEDVCREACLKQPDIIIEHSNDAGRYLCDFTYYTSLYQQKGPVIFIHVPPLDDPYSKAQLSQALQNIIECLLHAME